MYYVVQYINCLFMFEVPESASPEGFRGTHHSGTLLQGGYCNDIMALLNNSFTILISKIIIFKLTLYCIVVKNRKYTIFFKDVLQTCDAKQHLAKEFSRGSLLYQRG